ncbi:hypothetical protein WY02_03680 [Pseudonocardia sp. AL041005-10]|nr:hypothetical protein [Pseudonocardia sp. AL041005-10]ALE77696.1 hypothetical protein WY02_03680 [Pseudonocardia sp. AL041005-10]
MTEIKLTDVATRWEVTGLPPEPDPGTVVRDRDGEVWHRRPSKDDSSEPSRWWRAGALVPLFGSSAGVRRWDQLLLDHGPLTLMVAALGPTPTERDPETAEAAELGVAALRSRIRVLEAEVSQTVDRSYRSAIGDLVGLFHPRSAGLQTLRELGDADHKITLTDVVAAIGIHVQGNTLGAPPDYQPPTGLPPEERAAFATAVSELKEQS